MLPEHEPSGQTPSIRQYRSGSVHPGRRLAWSGLHAPEVGVPRGGSFQQTIIVRKVNGADALDQAGKEFAFRLGIVSPSDWNRPTPCDEWDVRALVNHVVGGNVRYRMILDGQPDEAVLATHARDMLGHDPLASFDTGLKEVTEIFALPGALDRTVRHPKSGEMSGRQLRLLRVDELAIHAWDLARAVDADDRLDRELVGWLYEHMKTIEPLGKDLGPEPATGDLQQRLLHLLGRQG
jgi:uncharacterized protein (TIGR03086 family)